jgi:short-subunit dehydrogenase
MMSKTIPAALAVITGASSGIGAAYAERLAARGHALMLVARRAERLAELKAGLEQRHGASVVTITADLENPDDLHRLESRLGDGGAGMLINNAGAGGLGPLAASSADQLERIVRLNVLALTRLSHAALKGFRKAGAGVLVNIGSVIAFAPSAAGAVYSGSKAYVHNFTRSLQLEYAKSDIRVQLVMPGPVRTEFFSSQGLSDSIFADESYVTPETLVDAALAGLDAEEAVTTPTLTRAGVWEALEAARVGFIEATMSGKVAPRYVSGAAG